MSYNLEPSRTSVPNPEPLHVAVISESGLGYMSGVTRSAHEVLGYLNDNGHQAMAVCPSPTPLEFAGAPVLPSHHLTLRGFNVGLSRPSGKGLLAKFKEVDFTPDIIHAASPFGPLGTAAIRAAKRLNVPCVAVYQTNMPEYLVRSGAGIVSGLAKWHAAGLHNSADLMLVPSSAAHKDLLDWGVDAKLFNPDQTNSGATQLLREKIAPDGEPIIGYVGRLAPEKELERLAVLTDLEAKLVVVGKGPEEAPLKTLLGDKALFLGEKRGQELAQAYGLLDIFIHTGTNETFGQTLQEAMASGKPVIAPGRWTDRYRQARRQRLFI